MAPLPPVSRLLVRTDFTDDDAWDQVRDEATREYGPDGFRAYVELWGVDNNLSISNMDWDEFADAVDDDGVFRGFEPLPPAPGEAG